MTLRRRRERRDRRHAALRAGHRRRGRAASVRPALGAPRQRPAVRLDARLERRLPPRPRLPRAPAPQRQRLERRRLGRPALRRAHHRGRVEPRPRRAGAPLRGGAGHPRRRGPDRAARLRRHLGAEPRGPARGRGLGRRNPALRGPRVGPMSDRGSSARRSGRRSRRGRGPRARRAASRPRRASIDAWPRHPRPRRPRSRSIAPTRRRFVR